MSTCTRFLHRPAIPLALVTPLSHAADQRDVAVKDWDLLFAAVLARLGSTLDELHAAKAGDTGDARAGLVQTAILECVQALEQLRSTMAHERARSPQAAAAQARPDHDGFVGPS